jgi:RNA polymerase sigma-70 factor (ECF subfamily)
MSEQVSEFRQAIERICAGDAEAAWDFIVTYGPHIQRVVRHRLHQKLRPKFDSMDFVQMVWASFFADPRRIAGMREPAELIGYLVTMARNKVIDESRRRLKYQKHNVNRECSLEDVDLSTVKLHQRPETPSQIAMARERWLRILRGRPERTRRAMELRVNGASFGEIGAALGIHERTAREMVRSFAESADQS